MNEQIYNIFNLKLLEPGAFITDLIISIVSFIFYIKIKKINSYEKPYLYYRYFFLFMSISTLLAAFAHLLYLYTDKNLHLIAWIFTALSTYFFDRAVLINWNNKIIKITIWYFINIQFLMFVILILLFKDFTIVTINIAISISIIALPILVILYIKQNQKGNLLMFLGIFVAILPALIFKSNFMFLKVLTAKDISHLIIVLCLYFIYLGIIKNHKYHKSISNY